MSSTAARVRHVLSGSALYPVTTVYVGAVGVTLGVAGGTLRLDVGLIALGVLAAMAIVLATLREVQVVHLLVDAQREELRSRIEVLVALLIAHGIELPTTERPARRSTDGGRPR